MDFKKTYLDEIMKLPIDNSVTNTLALSILYKNNIKTELVMNEDNTLMYSCKVGDILNSDIDNESLINLRYNGWGYDINQEFLIKKL